MKKAEKSDFGRMLAYCDALSKNNERPWFHENHKWYEDAKADYEELLELMRFYVSEAAPTLSSDVMYMRVKDWMYRVPRDARVKNGKPPYNPSFRRISPRTDGHGSLSAISCALSPVTAV